VDLTVAVLADGNCSDDIHSRPILCTAACSCSSLGRQQVHKKVAGTKQHTKQRTS